MISSLIIFCFVVGAVLAAEGDSRSAYIKTQENKRLHGYVVKKIDSTDEMSCSKACLRHSWCTSSNFKESSGNCELNKHEFSTTDDDTKLTANSGTTFSMFLKGCLMAGCLNGGSCLFDEGKDAFACSCSPQWRGDKCEMDINECETGKLHCDSNAFCNNTKGSYICTCKPGYTGNGVNCSDINECETGKHHCDSNAFCSNTKGSYICTCKPGYNGNGVNCTALLGYFDWKPGQSCLNIKTLEGERAVSGAYWLNETGSLFQVYCQMESNNVWTLLGRFSMWGGKNWMKDSGEWWYDKNVSAGETADPLSNKDMISPAFWLVRGNEIKITRNDDPQHIALLQTTSDCLGGQTFRSKITSYGDFRNGTTWRNNRCLGNCTVQYGGQYETTQGFGKAKCNGTILSGDKIGFWCDRGGWDGAVVMIGGGGRGICDRTSHRLGITAAYTPSFLNGDRAEQDFGNSPYSADYTGDYSLNLWIR